jgi:ribonuclease HII
VRLPPLSALREQLLGADGGASRELLKALEGDTRKGAQDLLETLRARQKREKAERLRQTKLLAYERPLWDAGLLHVAGVDEVGVGPLAGPVIAAAVILPPDYRLKGLNDSKQVSHEHREALAARIREDAVAFAVAHAEVEEIDRLNIYHAALLAMRRAVSQLAVPAQHVLVDARKIPDCPCPQQAIVKGDALSASIAAASLVAKVARDNLMAELDLVHPGWGFALNAGYPTPEHLRALRERAPSPIHRLSFAPVREAHARTVGPPRHETW